jgi:hypothetical protein
MFDYDWFHGTAFQQQKNDAIHRCTVAHFPDTPPAEREKNADFARFRSELETRCLVYLRDGFSYEIKEFAALDSKTHLTFECEPVDEQYKAGAFVVSVPFDEIIRVEVFAVHPAEKPDDMPQITGFRSDPAAEAPPHPHPPPSPRRKERPS